MIRPFESADLDRILWIETRAFPKSPYDPATFLYYHRNFPNHFLTFEKENILGYIIFTPGGHIVSLAVAPDHRRRGIGTLLVNECSIRCKGTRPWLEVRRGNLGAQRFYEKLGFRKTAVIPGYYGTEDAYVMEKQLSEENR